MANDLIRLLRRFPAAGSLIVLLGTILAGTTAGTTARAATPAGAFEGLQMRIEQGYRERDLARIGTARADLLALAASADHSSADRSSAAYYAAYARFRQALATESDRQAARAYLEDCITELRGVVRGQPEHAEARALLGSCLGLSTLSDVVATVTRGLEARRQMAEARRLAPENPWVVMQDGLADWATPRLFGGDRNLALAKLEQATGLFTTAIEAGSAMAVWGAAEAWQQLGIRYQELGRTGDARAAFDRANAVASARVQLAAVGP